MKKPRVLKSWSKRNIPLEIWPHILSRLPVKSVLKFRRVSKSWQALIDDPSFFHLHLNNFKNNRDETHLFIVERSVKDNNKICIVRSCKTLKKTATLNSLDTAKLGDHWDAIFLVDGLVMIQHGTRYALNPSLMLWNPSIRKSRFLPTAPEIPNASFNIDLGFGFSPLINDYKHVRLVLSGYSSLLSVLIYTVGMGSWKTIGFQGEGISDWRWDFDYDSRWKVVCFNGVLYFVSSYTVLSDTRNKELVSFDLSRELFGSISLPVDDDVVPDDECYIEGEEPVMESDKFASKVVTVVDRGCTLAVAYLLSSKGSVWVMEASGEWNKRYTFIAWQEIMQEDFMRPKLLYVTKHFEMMCEWWPRQVTSYNLETDKERSLVKTAQGLDWRKVSGYVESLALMKG